MSKTRLIKRPNLLSVKLLLSYLSILALPMLAIVVVYVTASDSLYAIQQERMHATLQATAVETQRHLEEATNLGVYISSMPEFSQMQKQLEEKGGKAAFYDMYQLSGAFPDYSLFNSAIRDIYFFFNNQDYVIRLPTVVPADERSYATIGDVMAEDYDAMERFLGEVYREMQVVTLSSKHFENRQIGVVQSFPYASYEKPLGTMLILLDYDALGKRLRSNLVDGEGLVVMLDADGAPIATFAGQSGAPDMQQLDFAQLAQKPFSNVFLGGRQYAATYARMDTLGYSFYSLVPESVLQRRVGWLLPIIAVLCALSVVVGLTACVLLWNRRRRLVLRYSRYADEFGAVEKQQTNMWDGLHAVMDSMAQLQTTIQLQSGLVRSSVVQRLLEGGYSEQDLLEHDLRSCGVQLDGALYCVAAITFNRGFRTVANETLNEFRLRMLETVEKTLDIPHYSCEPEDMVIAIVVPITGEGGIGIVKKQLCALEDHMVAAQRVEAYIGLGACVSDKMEICAAYREARSVCEHLRFYNFRSVMEFSEMPTSHEVFHFPLEMELRFIRAIEQGDSTQLQELFGQLAVENFAVRQLTYETQKRLLELVRCTAVRALRGSDKPCAPLPGDAALYASLNSTDSLEQIFVLLESHMANAAQNGVPVCDEKTDARKEEIRALLVSRYHEEGLTIASAAQDMGSTETKFYKEFKQLFGVTFSEYLENLRIAKACDLLKARTRVKDVSELVGYGSDYSFRRAFKRVTGIAPSTYTENLQK